MGIDDRDYMRERHRRRASETRWSDRAARVEGAWFDPVNRGQDYQNARARPRIRFRPSRLQLPVFALTLLLSVLPLYNAAKRQGWVPDLTQEEPFPESGSVTAADGIARRHIDSVLAIRTSGANAVVQLIDPRTDAHVLTIYVAKDDRVQVPVPSGTFRLRLIEGQKWHGAKRYFGASTSYETVAQLMTFVRRSGHAIDLNRRPDGNMPTRMMLSGPDALRIEGGQP